MTCLREFSQKELKDRVLRIFRSFAFGNQAKVIHPDYVSDYTLTVDELNKSLYFNILAPVRKLYLEYGGEGLLKIVDKIKSFLTSIHNQAKKTFSKEDYISIYKRFMKLKGECLHCVL